MSESVVIDIPDIAPIGSNMKCCWVCRDKGSALTLFPRNVGYYCFKAHYGYLQDLENMMWNAGTPYQQDLESGIQMKWMCTECSSTSK